MEYLFLIDGVEYTTQDVQSVNLRRPLFDKLSVGNVCSAELNMTFWPLGAISPMAKIAPKAREASTDPWTPLGEFYIYTREKVDESLHIIAYDRVALAERPWVPADGATFPMPMSTAVDLLAMELNLQLDSRNIVSSTYTVDYPANGDTIRDVLGYIAAAHAGNWVLTRDSKLWLQPLLHDTGTQHSVGRAVQAVEHYDTIGPITGVALDVDGVNVYHAGSTATYELSVQCPYGTQEMAENILNSLKGKIYRGYKATDAALPLTADLGDGIQVDNVVSILAYQAITFGPKHLSEIGAPGESTLEHEYPYAGSVRKDVQRQVAQAASYFEKTLDRITMKVIDADGKVSEVSLLDQGQIDLTGYATFRGLSEGTTVIDGGCIRADSEIRAPKIIGGKIFAADDSDGSQERVELTSEGLVIMTEDGAVKLKLGYVEGDYEYPYVQLGAGSSAGNHTKGLLKKFLDGLWIGNSAPAEATGRFAPKSNYLGMFFSFETVTAYVVQGTDMQNIYTGEAIAKFG